MILQSDDEFFALFGKEDLTELKAIADNSLKNNDPIGCWQLDLNKQTFALPLALVLNIIAEPDVKSRGLYAKQLCLLLDYEPSWTTQDPNGFTLLDNIALLEDISDEVNDLVTHAYQKVFDLINQKVNAAIEKKNTLPITQEIKEEIKREVLAEVSNFSNTMPVFQCLAHTADAMVEQNLAKNKGSWHVIDKNLDAELIKFLTHCGCTIAADADALNSFNKAGYTPLIIAAQNNLCQIGEKLIKKLAKVNLSGAGGGTALYHAVHNGHRDFVELLLANGADVEIPHKGVTPLYQATYNSNEELVGLLLEHKANPLVTYKGVPMLLVAFMTKNPKTCEQLIKHGAAKNMQEKILDHKKPLDIFFEDWYASIVDDSHKQFVSEQLKFYGLNYMQESQKQQHAIAQKDLELSLQEHFLSFADKPETQKKLTEIAGAVIKEYSNKVEATQNLSQEAHSNINPNSSPKTKLISTVA